MAVPTARLAGFVAAGALAQFVAALLNPEVGLLVFLMSVAVVVVVVVIDLERTADPADIEVRRGLPAAGVINQPSTLSWFVRNRSGRSATVAIADVMAPSLRARTQRFEMELDAGAGAEVSSAIRPGRRGLYSPSEVTVRTLGPSGLVWRQKSRPLESVMRVLPRFPSRADAELRVEQAKLLELGVRSSRLKGGGTEFDQLREYTVDDETRRIDWSATARVGRPIVRTYRAERNQTVVNLLDTGRVMAGRVQDVPRIEHAMDAVMTLTSVAAAVGDRVGFGAFDRSLHSVVPLGSGRGQLARVTEAMFDIEPALVESNYRAAFAELLARFRRRSLFVVHTDLAEQVVTETLVPALPQILRSHVVFVVAVSDPVVVRWASGAGLATADEVRRYAAARMARADRERASRLLRALGATVIDAEPGAVSAKLADAYLDLKSRGAL